jgi:hypothetical protein
MDYSCKHRHTKKNHYNNWIKRDSVVKLTWQRSPTFPVGHEQTKVFWAAVHTPPLHDVAEQSVAKDWIKTPHFNLFFSPFCYLHNKLRYILEDKNIVYIHFHWHYIDQNKYHYSNMDYHWDMDFLQRFKKKKNSSLILFTILTSWSNILWGTHTNTINTSATIETCRYTVRRVL